jgi:hypothetical protein
MEGEMIEYTAKDIEVKKLLLDSKNPRLPDQISMESYDEILLYVAEEYDSLSIARSISLYGYFPSEPLIAIPKDNDCLIVVEGNRRLTALKLLLDSDLRDRLEVEFEDEWNLLSSSDLIPKEVPVIKVNNRKDVAPIIGYRHISGIEPWDPWAKSRFIASLLDENGVDFENVAEQVGESRNGVAANYRNYKVLKRAHDLDVNTEEAESKFGVFERAMVSPGLREHIGAPIPSEMQKETNVVKDEDAGNLQELFRWLFGENKVITDSRDITRLGYVVALEDGLRNLRDTRNLEEAYIASGGLKDRLLKRLNQARSALLNAEEDFPNYIEDCEVIKLYGDCVEAISKLKFHLEN